MKNITQSLPFLKKFSPIGILPSIALFAMFFVCIGSTHAISANAPEAIQQAVAHHFQLSLPISLSAPSVHLAVSVNSVPTWNPTLTDTNFLESSAQPNPYTGNTVIFGKQTESIFQKIHSLKKNDIITISTKKNKLTYTVEKTFISNPFDIQLFKQTNSSQLTITGNTGYVVIGKYTN